MRIASATCRDDPVHRAGGGRPAPARRRRPGRSALSEIAALARPGQGHHPRHPAHPAATSASSTRTRHRPATGSAPACCSLGTSYLDRQRAALRARSTGPTRSPRAAARRSGSARRPRRQVLVVAPRLPARRHAPDLDVGDAAAAARHRAGQGACSPTRRGRRHRLRRRWSCAQPDGRTCTGRDARRARSPRSRQRGWAAEVEEMTPGEAAHRGADPRPAAGSVVGAIGHRRAASSELLATGGRPRRAGWLAELLVADAARCRSVHGHARPVAADAMTERTWSPRSTRARRRPAASSSTTPAAWCRVGPARAPAVLPAARAGSSTTPMEIWRNVAAAGARGAAPAPGLDRRRRWPPRHRQPARDHGACGTAHTGRPRRPRAIIWQDTRTDELVAELVADAGTRSSSRTSRPAAGHLLRRARGCAGCSTTSPGCARAPSAARCSSARWRPG